MSLTSLPVSTLDLENLQLGILRISNPTQAAAEAALINAQITTVQAYADSLLASSARASETTVGIISSFTNVTPTNAQLDFFVLTFAPPQIANAIANGLNQVVYLAEAIGLGFGTSDPAAIANFTGQTAFPNTQAGDVAFVQTAAAAIYGPANTPNLVNVFQVWVTNWKAFYTAHGLPGNPTPTADQIDTAARAAAFGDAVGVAIENNIGPLRDFADGVLIGDSLFKNGEGPNILGVSNATAATIIASNPSLEGGTSSTFNLTIGVDNFSTTQVGAIFNALPGSNPPLGNTNTLNSGDNLQDSAGDGVLNLTQVDSIINPEIADGVTMNGISDAFILNLSSDPGGFNGNITGLHSVTLLAGSNAGEILGTAGFGLNTALGHVTLQASRNFTAWVTNTALAGAGDTINVNLSDANIADHAHITVAINTAGGGNQYETLNLVTDGGGSNDVTLNSNAGIPTINVSGGQALTIDGSALNLDPLVTFDASGTSGGVDATFSDGGNATVIGGSGADHFTFPATAGDITVSGNAGDDLFTFLSTNGGTATFGPGDSADGGPGNDLLEIQADHGEILLGGTITALETVQHITFGNANGSFSANMANMGSATLLDLAGSYNGNDVTVNNLTDAQTVQVSGTGLDDLTFHHVGVIGTDNLQMTGTTIDAVHTDLGDGLHINSIGDENTITDASDINSNVQITGNTHLNLGNTSAANAYAFDPGTPGGGLVDASLMTDGGVSIGLGTGNQTFTGSPFNDTVISFAAGTGNNDEINISNGGSDVVQFHFTDLDGTKGISSTSPNYNHITGFNVADDVIQIDATFAPAAGQITLQETNATGVFNPAAIFNYDTGTALVNLAGSFTDAIKVDSAVGGGQTAQTLFNAAMGATGSIIVAGAADDILFMAYNNDTSQAVLMVVHPGAVPLINSGDDVDVVGQMTMSFTDYQIFGTQGSLVFV